MDFTILIFLVIALAGSLYLFYQRSKANKKAAQEFENAPTFEDKMMILQKASLKRLKGIDTTLDYFFWFFVIGLAFYFLYYLVTAMALL